MSSKLSIILTIVGVAALTVALILVAVKQEQAEKVVRVEVDKRIGEDVVATFVGENNPFYGRVIETLADGHAVVDTTLGRIRGVNATWRVVGDNVIVFVRPERCKIAEGADFDNVIESTVDRLDFEGAFVNLFLHGQRGKDIIVHMTNDGRALEFQAGMSVKFGFSVDNATILPEGELAAD